MNFEFQSDVFKQLLDHAAWARPFWQERDALVAAHRWNVNALNQGGNAATKEWLARFLPARAQASLKILQEPEAYLALSQAHAPLVAELETAPELSACRPGSPGIDHKDGQSMNFKDEIKTYTAGQFLADVILLLQPSLRGLTVPTPLDLSGMSFPVGLDLCAAKFASKFSAKDAVFGPFSDFSAAQFADMDLSEAWFSHLPSFTIAQFKGDTNFSNVCFEREPTFHATRFSGATRFLGAQFKEGASFAGAVFETSPDFSGAVFHGRTSFEDATFHASAHLRGASFPGVVNIFGLPKDVQDEILNAHHP
ncbi:MAG: pentapeptide repeat-containing protein [Alphaproteobacteria bacterium]|uniref:Pentapeptide repeat-containing protein n=1 Tax=Celeribacter baekdonensis TaxID=875171 RepID=A0A1G7G124_9RHOB|nr:pentapeptide repeat-containing protein [Celeribacter baekdonensis]MBU0641708.1 pentapeptide repeat-containing protein [Alphaproteobacteria bacterium]MBU1279036.1 pentapeptide repeat-containing protein [Alphaproteobacteria bacterium]MBU1574810.1 pentapeptide repeat-containing protein [Alphaproteobacteria bacterium]MBU1829707.1 pentapeptide repeat-containing protein [Alphaproteobacteria bacterium]MBU2079700.1 pentapeptide repeat-containing protein [Alphaproteobacteria bacterium]